MAGFADKLSMEKTNFLAYETLKLGVNYRWNDFISAQMCPELSTRLNTGYSDEYGVNELIELN